MVNDITTAHPSTRVGRLDTSADAIPPISGAGRAAPARAEPENGVAQDDLNSPAAVQIEGLLRSLQPPLIGEAERLSIVRDETTGTFIYRSVDKETGKVLNQWPAESMLQFKAYLKKAEGVLFDHRA